MLEIGGKNNDTIVTECPFDKKEQEECRVDAIHALSNYAIIWSPNSEYFTWFKFNQQQ